MNSARRPPVVQVNAEDTTVRDPSDVEDIQKVGELRSGDIRAFEFLFDKYREKVFRVAYRFLRDREDALEVTQDVFVRAYTGIAGFKTDSKFFTWLYRITINRAIDLARSRRKRSWVEVETPVLESAERASLERSPDPDPVEVAEEKELQERLAQAVARLSEKHRTVFLLHAMENLSYKEIADIMGSSIGTVMSRLFYARQKLQEALGRLGFERPGRRK